jgi:hypothetical protein
MGKNGVRNRLFGKGYLVKGYVDWLPLDGIEGGIDLARRVVLSDATKIHERDVAVATIIRDDAWIRVHDIDSVCNVGTEDLQYQADEATQSQ